MIQPPNILINDNSRNERHIERTVPDCIGASLLNASTEGRNVASLRADIQLLTG